MTTKLNPLDKTNTYQKEVLPSLCDKSDNKGQIFCNKHNVAYVPNTGSCGGWYCPECARLLKFEIEKIFPKKQRHVKGKEVICEDCKGVFTSYHYKTVRCEDCRPVHDAKYRKDERKRWKKRKELADLMGRKMR